MTPFSDLFRSHLELPPGEQQHRVEGEFPALVAQGFLHWWSPGDRIAAAKKRLLIGVATYSEMDMRLLDLVGNAVAAKNCRRMAAMAKPTKPGVLAFVQMPPESLRVDVFSVLACRTHEDFQKYVPGVGKVYQTPVVGFWEDDRLRESATGARGRALVARVCGIDPQLFDSSLT